MRQQGELAFDRVVVVAPAFLAPDIRSAAVVTLLAALRRKWRVALNLDGPWVCVGCRTWTLVRQADGIERCIFCGKRQCPCFDGFVDWCEHHGPSPEVLALEARARELSRVQG